MKSALVRKSRKSKKSAHMQGVRRSGDERLWRDELTLLKRSNSLRLLPLLLDSTCIKPPSLFYVGQRFNVAADFPTNFTHR
jgi:hypothetical protein